MSASPKAAGLGHRVYSDCLGRLRVRNRTPGPPPFSSMNPNPNGFVSLIAA
jgi:hypothetical protein